MIDIKFQLRRFVGRSPALYSAVQCFLRARPYQMVTEKTVMCLEGYPRSANTFSLNLVRGALIEHFPIFFSTHAERLVAHHTHRIATIKAARRHGIPTLVLLRSPNEAIPSRVVRESGVAHQEQRVLIRRDLKEYEDYYDYVLGHDDIQVIRFETVVGEPQTFVEFALDCIGLELPEDFEIAPVHELAVDSIEHWADKQVNHTALTENFSTEEKERQKVQVREKIKRRYPNALRRVRSLYLNLTQNARI